MKLRTLKLQCENLKFEAASFDCMFLHVTNMFEQLFYLLIISYTFKTHALCIFVLLNPFLFSLLCDRKFVYQ